MQKIEDLPSGLTGTCVHLPGPTPGGCEYPGPMKVCDFTAIVLAPTIDNNNLVYLIGFGPLL